MKVSDFRRLPSIPRLDSWVLTLQMPARHPKMSRGIPGTSEVKGSSVRHLAMRIKVEV